MRRFLLERLATGPVAVGELARDLPISRPAVSQHLRVLQDAGLVKARPEGTRRLYALDRDGIEAVRGYWEQIWNAALERFAATATEVADNESRGDDHGGDG
jgi:DNA-binding transcriptional ArsR family regulator